MLKFYTNVIILRVFWDLLSSFSITSHQYYCVGFPGGTRGKDPTCQCRRHKRCRFNPWARKIPWRRAWQCSCLRNLMDTGGCGAVQRVTETQTRVKGPSTHARTLLCVAVIQMCSRLYGILLCEYSTVYLTTPLPLDMPIASSYYRATINHVMSSCSPVSRMTRLLDIHIFKFTK